MRLLFVILMTRALPRWIAVSRGLMQICYEFTSLLKQGNEPNIHHMRSKLDPLPLYICNAYFRLHYTFRRWLQEDCIPHKLSIVMHNFACKIMFLIIRVPPIAMLQVSVLLEMVKKAICFYLNRVVFCMHVCI